MTNHKRFKKRVIVGVTFFLLFYTFFWLKYFNYDPFKKKEEIKIPIAKSVKGEKIVSDDFEEEVIPHPTLQDQNENLPQTYKLDLLGRKQSFGLSCEFAAAASVIYYFTNDPFFNPSNEKKAEETLIEKVGVSENPNIGIRMGKSLPLNSSTLFENLNQRFGGADYYGVHAPPFIDLFEKYGLQAKPIKKEDFVAKIQKAISSNHLLMAWISVGFGQAVDLDLSYSAKVPVVRGEHTVVIKGYDQKGVFVMDPGNGSERFISYENLQEAMKFFTFPLLEVYKSSSINPFQFLPTKNIDEATGLNRGKLKIQVENGTGKTGKANEVASVLSDFGYTITEIDNADNFDYEGITIKIKEKAKDYLGLLRKDFAFSSYNVASISADLDEGSNFDVLIFAGE